MLELRREGKLLLATSDTSEAVAFLEGLGVQESAPLVRGARRWKVEIHEESRGQAAEPVFFERALSCP